MFFMFSNKIIVIIKIIVKQKVLLFTIQIHNIATDSQML